MGYRGLHLKRIGPNPQITRAYECDGKSKKARVNYFVSIRIFNMMEGLTRAHPRFQ